MKNTKNYPLNDKRTITGWAFFDWANSAYALTIAVAIFPKYYNTITEGEIYRIFGFDITNTALYSFAISFAYLVVSILSPYLSGIADFSGKKLRFMRFFTYLGSVSCAMLFFFESASQVSLALIFFILATIGFAGGLVFYNSFLPDITTEEEYDRVSAKGFAYGYFGSVLLLIINLIIIAFPSSFGFDPEGTTQVRIAFVMVGIWWFGFSFIPFNRLPKDKKEPFPNSAFKKSVEKLKRTFGIVVKTKNIKRFLIAFFFYSAGVQTVLLLASIFADSQLEFKESDFIPEEYYLIVVILILQFLAIIGAYIFAFVSERMGNKFTLITMLFIWIIICIIAYFVKTPAEFAGVAAGVGLVMGGIQSLSRSTYSKLLPRDTPDTTSYFSFYDVLEKYSVVIGTFIFGIIDQLFGMRNSILALTVFFAIGIIALMTLKIKPAPIEG